MLDHMILTVSNVERSLAFYEAALKPLNIKFFLSYKGEGDHPICGDLAMARGRSSGSSKGSLIQRPFTGDSWPKTMVRSMNSTGRQYPLVPGTIFHRGHGWNTIRDTMPPTYLTRTGIRSRSFIKASDGTSHRQGTYSGGCLRQYQIIDTESPETAVKRSPTHPIAHPRAYLWYLT